MDMTKTEAQNIEIPSEEVTKGEVITDPQSTEKVETPAVTDVDKGYKEGLDALQTKFDAITEKFNTLLEAVTRLAPGVVIGGPAEKSETEAKAENEVTKTEQQSNTTDTDAVTVLKQAIGDTISGSINPLVEKMNALEEKIVALEQPVDKSLAVTGQLEVTDKNEIYELRKAAARKEGRDFDPLAEAVALMYNKR